MPAGGNTQLGRKQRDGGTVRKSLFEFFREEMCAHKR